MTATRANAFTMSSLGDDGSFEFGETTRCDEISSRELTLPDSEATAEATLAELQYDVTEEELYVDPTPLSCLPQPLLDETAERDAAALRRIIAMGSRGR